jgi:thymidylate kinase
MKNLIIIEGVDGSGKRSTSEAIVGSIKSLHPEKSVELISFYQLEVQS